MYEKHFVRTNKKWSWPMLILLALAVCLNGTTTIAQTPSGDGPIAEMTISPTVIEWQPLIEHSGLILLVTLPEGTVYRQEFEPGSTPMFGLMNPAGEPYPDGSYTYELRTAAMDADISVVPVVVGRESGQFTIADGAFVTDSGSRNQLASPMAPADQVILDDLIVDGSACIGFDCVNGESFGFDTIRLKENNLRIRFLDTSTSAGFPSNDWQITANDSSNGGANKFSIDDIDSGKTPFTIEAGTRAHALYVDDSGRIGFGKSTPEEDLHIWYGDTPTIRLDQSGSGWAPQKWDIAGNEANFFIRDVTNGSKLPFRIKPGAPDNSIFVDSDGKVGLGTQSPSARLEVKNAAGTASLLAVQDGGNVGIGTASPSSILHVVGDGIIRPAYQSASGTSYFRPILDFKRSRGTNTSPTIVGASDSIGDVIFKGYDGGTYREVAGFGAVMDGTPGSGDMPGALYFRTTPDGSTTLQERMRIANDGEVGIGTTSPNYLLHVNGSAGKPGGGSWSDSSDARLKENVNVIDGREALDLLSQLQGVTFEWVHPEEHSAGTQAGLLAQDLEKVFPDWVDEYEAQGSDAALIPEGEMALAIHFPHDFNAYVIEAIKALDAENQALSDRVEEQDATIATLEARVATLEALVESLLQAQSE